MTAAQDMVVIARLPDFDGQAVKSTSPDTENHYKNGYVNYKNFIKTNEDNNHDTKYTNKNDTNNHDARDLLEWAQQRAV